MKAFHQIIVNTFIQGQCVHEFYTITHELQISLCLNVLVFHCSDLLFMTRIKCCSSRAMFLILSLQSYVAFDIRVW